MENACGHTGCTPPIGMRRAVTGPLARGRDHGWACVGVHRAVFALHMQGSAQHGGVLIELGALPRLYPAGRVCAMLAAPVELLTRPMYSPMSFGFLPAASNARGLGNVFGHSLLF